MTLMPPALLDRPQAAQGSHEALRAVIEHWATEAPAALGGLLSEPVEMRLGAIVPADDGEIENRCTDGPAAAYTITVRRKAKGNGEVLSGDVRIGLDRACLFALMNAAFGGDASGATGAEARPATALEMRIARAVFDAVVPAFFASVGSDAVEVTAAPASGDRRRPGMQRQAQGSALVATVDLAILNGRGALFLAIPRALAECLSLQPGPDASLPTRVPGVDPRWARHMHDQIAASSVTVHAMIDGCTMTLGDIAGLTVGQIIPLPAGANDAIILECREQQLSRCRLGKSAGRFTLVIDAPIEASEPVIADLIW